MNAENDETPPIAKWLTLTGRLLLVATVLGCAAVFFWYFMRTVKDLPAGSYPIFLWLAPIVIAGCLFFFGAAWLFEKFGVPIYKKSEK